MLRRAARRARQAGLHQVAGLARMDACRLAFPDAWFDVVVAPFVLTVLPQPQASLDEWLRVLRPGGEIVLVIAPPQAPAQPSADDADALLRQALARASLKDAVGEVAQATGLPRRDLYQRALALAKEESGETQHGAPR